MESKANYDKEVRMNYEKEIRALTEEVKECKNQLHKFLLIFNSEERLGAKVANHIMGQGVSNEKVRNYLATMSNEELLRVLGV